MNTKIIGGIIVIVVVAMLTLTYNTVSQSFCGDGQCTEEDGNNCLVDCGGYNELCGNNYCAPTETIDTCEGDCSGHQPVCGDLVCDYNENYNTCPKDCENKPYWCGDEICSIEETSYDCPSDCGNPEFCGDGVCEGKENTYNCPMDCGTVCIDECTPRDLKCATTVQVKICEEATSWHPCSAWIDYGTCGTGEVCLDGMCDFQNTWQESYTQARIENNIPDKYISGSSMIDINSPEIQNLKNQLIEGTTSPKEYAQKVIRWVETNIQYNLENGDFITNCLNMKASEQLEHGKGVCSSMTKINLALLQAGGIAARPVEGCVVWYGVCVVLFDITKAPLILYNEPVFSDGKYYTAAGGLHTWGEIWLPEHGGWVVLESTTGRAYDTSCLFYRRYRESELTEDMCYITDPIFAEQCEAWAQ